MRKEPTASSTTCRSSSRALLVVAPNWLGDAVMATPFLLILRRAVPGAAVTLLCGEYVSEVFRRSSAVDRLITYDRRRKLRSALPALGRNRPDGGWETCYVLPRSFSSALLGFLSGARRRIGYRGEGRDILLTDSLGGAGYRAEHLSIVYARLIGRVAGAHIGDVPLPVVVPPYGWAGIAGDMETGGGYYVLAPGATYGSAKIWPCERYAELAGMIAARTGWSAVVIGTAGQREFAGRLLDSTEASGRNLAGELSSADLLSVIRGGRLIIGNDSGPVHLSAAMGRPTVAIFGSTSPAWTAPRGASVRIVSSDIDCEPCFERDCPKGDPRCLTDIRAGEVFDAACDVIEEGCNEAQ